MNCSQWEERIALYAGGDLLAPEAAEVNGHLAECPGCQIFASGLRESVEWIRTEHQEPVAEAHFAAVRARVLSKLEYERRPWWRGAWVYGWSAAALALFLILVVQQRKPAPAPYVATQGPAVNRPAPEEPLVPAPEPVHSAHAIAHRRPKLPILPVEAPPDPGSPVVVKLLTDDPEVVIYWISDNPGE